MYPVPNALCCHTVALAEITKLFLTKYDNLFECSFPYSMGWHGERVSCVCVCVCVCVRAHVVRVCVSCVQVPQLVRG